MSGTAYHPPVKRSVTIAGHQTSISLEPMFWTALE
ncbi:MAG: ribbon-helix-helix domain-containing protein, partial [Sphingomonadales bacterium]|nr:ribbon-helix-helix domain-containing protein [Sphingomonadales bacterium]